jgi:integrase
MAREQVKRNVVKLCGVPNGQLGRPSKSLTYSQASAVLDAAEGDPLEAYIVNSLLTGARTEEMRALGMEHLDLDGVPDREQPLPPSMDVFRSVREGGDTKTKLSRRTLALPQRGVIAFRRHLERQAEARKRAGDEWQESGLVFTTRWGAPLGPHHVERGFRRVLRKAGLDPDDWVPRELRHSFVSLLSDHGLSLDDIARLCGHAGTGVTETVYRHQLRPVLLNGTVAMDRIFAADSVAQPNDDRLPDRRADRRAS